MRDQVQEVKDKTDIISLIGEYVNLKQAGTRWKGLCPFHSEKSPSFVVSPDMQIYKCFGCGESGDVFTFLEKHEGMEFFDALKFLAARAGVTLETKIDPVNKERDEIYEVNTLAAQFYHYLLIKHESGEVGKKYILEKRGLTNQTIEAFQVGFAPENRDALFQYLTRQKKFKPDLIALAGVCVKTRDGFVDRFRGRIIFPIANHHGHTVALAGRILPEFDTGKVGKYINSPETLVYHKSDSLYGLAVTKGDIKRAGSAVIVEGELDLLSSWQNGVKNIVAIKGSALTEGQMRTLSRYAKSIILALDSDFAGNKAALSGLLTAQKMGLTTKVAYLSPFKDPDEFARADSQGYLNALKNAVPVWDFIIDYYFLKFDSGSGEGISQISREVIPLLAQIEDRIVQTRYINTLAMKLSVEPAAVEAQLRKIGANPVYKAVSEKKTQVDLTLEEQFLGLCLTKKPELLHEKEIVSLLKNSQNLDILNKVLSFMDSNKFDLKSFSETLEPELKERFQAIVLSETDEEESDLETLKKRLYLLQIEDQIAKLREVLSTSELRGNEEKALASIQELDKLAKIRAQLTTST